MKTYLISFKSGKEITVTESVAKSVLSGIKDGAISTIVEDNSTNELLLVIVLKDISYMHLIPPAPTP